MEMLSSTGADRTRLEATMLQTLLLVWAPHALAWIPPVPRETVNFDFAWRFQRAVEPRYPQCAAAQQGVNYGWPDLGGRHCL